MRDIHNERYQTDIERVYAHIGYQGQKNAKTLVRIVKKYCRSPILDVGAGEGSLVIELRNRGFDAEGIDINPKHDLIETGSITEIPKWDSHFQTIFATEVLEHLTHEQIDAGLREIRRVARQGARVIITVPFEEDLEKNSFRCPECGAIFHKVGHLQSFSQKRMCDLLESYGFSVVRSDVYVLGAMSKLPLGRYWNWLFRRLSYDVFAKTLVIVCTVNK